MEFVVIARLWLCDYLFEPFLLRFGSSVSEMDFHLLKYELEGEESEASMAFQSLGMQRSPLVKAGTMVWNHRSQRWKSCCGPAFTELRK